MVATKQSQTRDRVSRLIESLDIGSAIPPERELSADLGVSRLTVRAALEELAREGYLVRRRGSGTFVSRPKIEQELTMTSFSEDMRLRGMSPGSKTLSLTTGPAEVRLGRCLRVSPAEPIVTARRLRLADGAPMALETLSVRASLVPGLTRRDLDEASFYELLAHRYGITIARGTQTIEPTVTNREESDLLKVPLHSPAFLFERTSLMEGDEVIEFVRSVYRGDRYQLVSTLNRRDRAFPAPSRTGQP